MSAHGLIPRSIAIFIGLCFAVALGLTRDARPTEAGVPVVIVVNTTADEDGLGAACSLREAIIAASVNTAFGGCTTGGSADPDNIVFNLGVGTPTIGINTSLPLIAGPVVIDGNTFGADRVELRGPGIGNVSGLLMDTMAAGSRINRLVINGFTGTTITIGAADVTLTGNFIGTDASGTAKGVNGSRGVDVTGAGAHIGGTTGTTPGGSCTGDCNLISGFFDGIYVRTGANAVIEGNFIGTDVTGTMAIGNTVGIRIEAPGAMVGGPSTGQGNLVSGNSIGVIGVETVTVQGNLIGTDTTGMNRLSNNGEGIKMFGANSVIGGVAPGAGNVISGNLLGVRLFEAENVQVLGNFIGTAADGVTPLGNFSVGVGVEVASSNNVIGGAAGNTIAFNNGDGVHVDGLNNGPSNGNQIRGNSVHDNGGKGIELINGGNTELAPPVILTTGSASGTSCPNCTIDVYSDDEDEGRTYEGSTTADSNGAWTFNGSVTGPFVTATATDGGGNTSEFSEPRTLPFPTPTPSPLPTSTPSPSPTPTSTVIPTPTATATSTPTPATETPTITAEPVPWGDSDCSGTIGARDNQALLRHVLSQPPLSQTEPCPDLGDVVTIGGTPRIWGDWDCSGEISARDNQALLRQVLSQSALSQTEPCPDLALTVDLS